MLARRFTIVCLLTALFGMLFAILVAEASRSGRARDTGIAMPCRFDQNFNCATRR